METIENTATEATDTTEEKALVLEQENSLLKQENEELRAKVQFYEEQFRLSQQQKYGASSEKVPPEQLRLFNEAEKLSAQPAEEPVLEEVLTKRSKGQTKSRRKYEELPVEEVYYTLAEEDQNCPNCDHPLHEMKTEVRREIKVIPAKTVVVHHIQQVYACRSCDQEGTGGTIITAPAPKPVLPGSMVSPSMLAFIMEQKYNKALPLYRQEQAFENAGFDVSRQNLANWVIKGSDTWLQLLYERMHRILEKEPVIHADESPLQVLDEKGKGYMWLYASAKSSQRALYLYEYQPSRAKKHPKLFLSNFKGYLQTDGYSGYNAVEHAIRVGCMAHARRKFTDAIKALPKGSETTATAAHEGRSFFSRMYRMEKQFAELSPQERFEARQKHMRPVLEQYRSWLEAQQPKTLPKSKLGTAISYSVNQWDELTAFMLDGRIAIDNNLAERAIKPFVIGRKNYLFAKSPKGARASAICYSVIETAKANGLKPFEYLTYLFEQLPNVDVSNPDVLDALLPWSKTIPDEIRKPAKEEE